MRLAAAILCLLLLTGFTNPDISRSLASGAIGCTPEDVGIRKEDSTRGVHSFIATCHGVDYFCTYIYPAPISCNTQADLTPEQKQAALVERAEQMDVWIAGVLRKAIANWKRPEQVYGTEIQVLVQVDGEGELLDLNLEKSGGVKAVDKSVIKAFKKADPFDPPPDTGVAFKGVVITFPLVVE